MAASCQGLAIRNPLPCLLHIYRLPPVSCCKLVRHHCRAGNTKAHLLHHHGVVALKGHIHLQHDNS